MIVPMKKIFLIVQEKDSLLTLERLQSLGTLHVEHVQTPKSPKISDLKEKRRHLEKTISLLSQEPPHSQKRLEGDWNEKVCEILGLIGIIDQYKEGISQRQTQIHQWEFWGDFDPQDIDLLSQKGLFVHFVEVPDKELAAIQLPEGCVLEKIFDQEGISRCLIISREKLDLPYTMIDPPAFGLNAIKKELNRCCGKIKEAENQIINDAKFLEYFQDILSQMNESILFEEVYAGKGEEETLVVLKGYCPADTVEALKTCANEEQWALFIEDPSEEDAVPTLIRNPKWVNLVKPVFNFINILPGYKELDISIFFLFFFSIFVGIIIGDAGYGLLFILMTAGAQWKYRNRIQDKTPFFLIYLLSATAFVWGVLTATFFGQQWLPESLAQPLLPWLTDTNNIQTFCFTLGAIHLSVAHIWRMILKWPNLTFLSDVGWFLLIWVMFFLAKYLILGALSIPLNILAILAVFAAGLILFFTLIRKNILKALGETLVNLSFGLAFINAFTDVVSYIRLFAVGLAAVAVADAANQMASQVPFYGAFFILLIGHSLNIVLSLLAILVHGLRLNVLEFSGHLNLEWAGFAFSPFRKLTKS